MFDGPSKFARMFDDTEVSRRCQILAIEAYEIVSHNFMSKSVFRTNFILYEREKI